MSRFHFHFYFLLGFIILNLASTQTSSSVVLTPETHGRIPLHDISADLFIGYGTVNEPTRISISPEKDGLRIAFQPLISSTIIPMLLMDAADTYIIDAPGTAIPIPEGDYLIYFDTVQVFAQHSEKREILFSIGMLENFHPDLLRRHGDSDVQAVIDSDGRHILIVDSTDSRQIFDSASLHPRYAPQFIGQALKKPAAFQFLGWSTELSDVIRAMFPAVPHGANLPAPGEQESPIPLWLPFDCAQDWIVSWGFHHSTQQNRYAVDFAVSGGIGLTQGVPVRAAHAGTLYLKSFNINGEYIDQGIAARVVHEDRITSTEYGHLDASTFAFWNLTAEDTDSFEWIEVAPVKAGEIIAFAGNTGYTTGAHLHFVLWTYDQSIYRPVFDSLREFERGFALPASRRNDCARYPF